MELSAAWVGAGAGVISLIGGALIRWIDNSLTAVKATQKLLFDKSDNHGRDLQDYKLHVAETYLTRVALREQLEPIHKTLEEIKEDLRDERHK
jgi:hypothetical protein